MAHVTDQLNTALADRYIIQRELGAGGMALVYLATDLKHDRKVALKVLRPELAAVIGVERNRLFDVGPDGRFLMIRRTGVSDVSGDLVVVMN